MNISEIKKEANHLSPGEVTFLAAWFHHLARRRDQEYLAGLDVAWEAMESGDRVSLENYKRLSNDLNESGL
jgi:hypothetical protein